MALLGTRHTLVALILVVLTTTSTTARRSSAETVVPDQNCFSFFDHSCASIRVDSATAGAFQGAVIEESALLNIPTVEISTDVYDQALEEVNNLRNIGAFRIAAGGPNYEAQLTSKTEIQPTDAGNGETQVFTMTSVVSEFMITGPTSTVELSFDVSISGMLDRPTNPDPGGINVNHQWTLESQVNGNPVLTTLFSASINYNQLDVAPHASGTSGPSVTFSDLDGDDLDDDYQADQAIFDSVIVELDEIIRIRGQATTNIFAQGYESGDTSFWSHTSPNSSILQAMLPEGYTIVAVPSLVPGDANGDGKVDGLDYIIWASNFGDDPADDPPGSPANGDFDGNGVVNGLDYVQWAINFGQGPNDGAAVPEPAASILLAMGATTVFASARRRRR